MCCQNPPPPPPPTTTRPPPPPPTTRPPFKGDEYIPPPRDNELPDSTNQNPNIYLPPARDEGTDSSDQNPSVLKPDRGEDQLAPSIPGPPTQCPAATICTEIQFCTAEGVISKSPVILTRDQETYRVPLSECRNPERGFIGRCCRDPDYVDPWPTSILGQYNATILGFDDGSYKPDASENSIGRVQKGEGQLSLPIPGQASQNTYSRTPFQQGVNSPYIKSSNTPEPNSISQREKPAMSINHHHPQPNQQHPPSTYHNNHNSVASTYQQQQQLSRQQQPAQQQLEFNGYPDSVHPLVRLESEQQKNAPSQQPIVHRHVARQSIQSNTEAEPQQSINNYSFNNYQPIPTQSAFFQPIVAQEPQQPVRPPSQQQFIQSAPAPTPVQQLPQLPQYPQYPPLAPIPSTIPTQLVSQQPQFPFITQQHQQQPQQNQLPSTAKPPSNGVCAIRDTVSVCLLAVLEKTQSVQTQR